MTDSEKLDLLVEKVVGMEKELGDLKEDVAVLRADVSKVRLRIDNEICPITRVLAEDHIDASQKYNEIVKTNATLVMLRVQVNTLESKIREMERCVPA